MAFQLTPPPCLGTPSRPLSGFSKLTQSPGSLGAGPWGKGLGIHGRESGGPGAPRNPRKAAGASAKSHPLGSPDTHRCVLGEEWDQENKGLGEGSQTSSAATLPLLTLVSSLFHALARLSAPGPWHDCYLHRECPSPIYPKLIPLPFPTMLIEGLLSSQPTTPPPPCLVFLKYQVSLSNVINSLLINFVHYLSLH